jgi:hypothetical protein
MLAGILLTLLVSAAADSGENKSCVQSLWTDETTPADRQYDLLKDKNGSGESLSCVGYARPSGARDALNALKRALGGDTKDFLETYVEYPLVVNCADSHKRYSKHALRKHFGELFDKETRDLIDHTQVRDFDTSDKGLVVGPGTLWWHVVPKSGDVQLKALNQHCGIEF